MARGDLYFGTPGGVGSATAIGRKRMVHNPAAKADLENSSEFGNATDRPLIYTAGHFWCTPADAATILGLVTAGIAVVFQDFILAFCGWFVLMGPNGVRVRDWVEIDGVAAVQLGLCRTWLLETGNWTAHGHPTGRRVLVSERLCNTR